MRYLHVFFIQIVCKVNCKGRCYANMSANYEKVREYMNKVYETVVQRNPGEAEFHQAVKMFFNSIKNVLIKEPHYIEAGILERIVEPERYITFQVPWVDEEGTSFVEMNPVGTGQFKFVEWRQGTTLELERFDDYWSDEQSNVEKVFFEPVPENGSRVAMLKTGEADFIYPVPQQNVEELKGDDSIVVNETPSTIARYVSINTTKEPLNDERVRKAMNYAVDKDAYIQVVKDGYGNLLDSTMSTEVQHYAEQETYDFDLDKANELMAEAGYESGFEVEIWGNTTSETVKGMEFIKQQLEQINIDVKIQSMEEGTLSDEIYTPETPEESKVQLWYVSWSPSSGDADGATRSLC